MISWRKPFNGSRKGRFKAWEIVGKTCSKCGEYKSLMSFGHGKNDKCSSCYYQEKKRQN